MDNTDKLLVFGSLGLLFGVLAACALVALRARMAPSAPKARSPGKNGVTEETVAGVPISKLFPGS